MKQRTCHPNLGAIRLKIKAPTDTKMGVKLRLIPFSNRYCLQRNDGNHSRRKFSKPPRGRRNNKLSTKSKWIYMPKSKDASSEKVTFCPVRVTPVKVTPVKVINGKITGGQMSGNWSCKSLRMKWMKVNKVQPVVQPPKREFAFRSHQDHYWSRISDQLLFKMNES
jgi:hypothetical protein